MQDSTTRRRFVQAVGSGAAALTLTRTAVAQSDGTANETTSTTAAPETESESNDVTATIREGLTLKSWEWKPGAGRFVLEIESDTPLRIKISDTGAVMKEMASEGSGVANIPTRGVTLDSGVNTVRFDAVLFEEVAAVTIAASGGAVLVRTGSVPVGRDTVEFSTAGILAGVSAVGSGWFSFRKGREKLQESDEPEIDRIA